MMLSSCINLLKLSKDKLKRDKLLLRENSKDKRGLSLKLMHLMLSWRKWIIWSPRIWRCSNLWKSTKALSRASIKKKAIPIGNTTNPRSPKPRTCSSQRGRTPTRMWNLLLLLLSMNLPTCSRFSALTKKPISGKFRNYRIRRMNLKLSKWWRGRKSQCSKML